MDKKFVTFMVGKERYGVPIENVERILPVQYVTKVPKSPKAVLGVFELRGSTIPAIDARSRFDMPTEGEANNFVVVIHDEHRFAIQVDWVEGIVDFSEDEIDDPSRVISSTEKALVTGIGKKESNLTVLLEPGCLIPESFRAKAAKIA